MTSAGSFAPITNNLPLGKMTSLLPSTSYSKITPLAVTLLRELKRFGKNVRSGVNLFSRVTCTAL